jgi:hypothetical protein
MADCYRMHSSGQGWLGQEASTNARQRIDGCVADQSRSINMIVNVVNQEMGEFQNKVQRCSVACRDEIEAKGLEGSEAHRAFHGCNAKCADKYMDLLIGMEKRITNAIAKNST